MSAVADRLYRNRRIKNGIALVLSALSAAFGLFWLVWILWTTLVHGIAAMKPSLFTQMTPPPGADGGIASALMSRLPNNAFAMPPSAPGGGVIWVNRLGFIAAMP